jgi:hypothetical protein
MSTALAEVGHGPPPSAVQTFDMETYLSGLLSQQGFKQQHALAQVYDQVCLNLLGPNDVQKAQGREFKKKSAWRKLGRYFGISVECDPAESRFIPLQDGEWVAIAKARATAPWGQVWEDVGACGSDEQTGRRQLTYADAISTAMTRASNRAVSNLIAMGEVSAEEVRDQEEKKPGDMIMPIGQHKGTPIGGLENGILVAALEWIADDEKRMRKYARLARTIQDVLDERGPQEEKPAAPAGDDSGAMPPISEEAKAEISQQPDPADAEPEPTVSEVLGDLEKTFTAEGHTTAAQDGLPFDP